LRQTGTNFGDILRLPPADAKSALPWRSRIAASLSVRRKLEDQEAKGGRDRAAAPEAENVVRLPREWLGPPEELVPFGPSARAAGVERDESRTAGRDDSTGREPAGPDESHRREPAGPDDPRRHEPAGPAPDFWGEESAVLQDVIETPAEPDIVPEGVGESRPQVRRWQTRVAAAAALVLCAVAGTIVLASPGPRPVARIGSADPFGGSLPRAVAIAQASLTHAGTALSRAAQRVAAPRPHPAHQQAPAVSTPPAAVDTATSSAGNGTSQTVGGGSSAPPTESAASTGSATPSQSPPAEPAQPAASTNQPAHPSPLGGLACSC
jgi:hypothetical protein